MKVSVSERGTGIVRYIGDVGYGIELENANGDNNGALNGVIYFECKNNCGLFAQKDELNIIVEPEPPKPPNDAFNNDETRTETETTTIETEILEDIKVYGQFMKHPISEEEKIEQLQHPTMIGKPTKKEYQLYIGLYQAKNLLPADETGLSDPFVTIHLGGYTFKSDIIYKRLNPLWNRGYLLNLKLNDPLIYAPPLIIQVWDFDPPLVSGLYADDNDILGELSITAPEIVKNQLELHKYPKWYNIHLKDIKNTSKMDVLDSQVLLDLQLISGQYNSIELLRKTQERKQRKEEQRKRKEAKQQQQENNDNNNDNGKEITNEVKAKDNEDKNGKDIDKKQSSNLTGALDKKKEWLNKLSSKYGKKGKKKGKKKKPKRTQLSEIKDTVKINGIDLTPDLDTMELQIYVLGLRNVNASFSLSAPYVSIYFPQGQKLSTKSSNVPSLKSPNFCELFSIELELPLDVVFMPGIRIALFDTVLGVNKKKVGWCFIQLSEYINSENAIGNDGWINPSEFAKIQIQNQQTNNDKNNVNNDELLKQKQEELDRKQEQRKNKAMEYAKQKRKERQEKREKQATKQNTNNENTSDNEESNDFSDSFGDDADDNNENMERIMSYFKPVKNDDSETDIFSDDDVDSDGGWESDEFHDDSNDKNNKKKDENDMDWDELIGLNRIEELKDRDMLTVNMEDQLQLDPFIFSKIFKGKGKKKKHIADLKCLIRFKNDNKTNDTDPDNPNVNNEEKKEQLTEEMALKHLITPESVVCRLYILRALNLMPKDTDGTATCDPYLVIKLDSKEIENTKDSHKENTLNADFYLTFELNMVLPGNSQLEISVFDYNGQGVTAAVTGILKSAVGSSNDDLIGSTTIDIENRYFSKDWNLLKQKPIERRDLFSPDSQHKQGRIEIIVEILKDDISKRVLPIDITPPSVQIWEMRLIVWECKNVVSKDSLTGLNDLYCAITLLSDETIELDNDPKKKVKINNKAQKTDTHLRAKNGEGNFNWRMKWDVYIPCKKIPKLKLQLFDKDLFGDDAICESILNLDALYKKAFIKNDTVTLFQNGSNKVWLDNLRHPSFIGNQGEILISLQMLPKDVANDFPAGFGRNPPNQNPTLLAPPGRIGFSLNPFKLVSNIVGPTIMRKIQVYLGLIIAGLLFVMFAPVLATQILSSLLGAINPFK